MNLLNKALVEKISKIQTQLKAPKNQRNNFGNYNYRSCEDILEAVKPLLGKENLVMTITDEVIAVGNRIYVKSVVRVTDGEAILENSALARESEDKKGMDSAQITGSTSSYARKYALNGMFLIDDTKDADATNDHGKSAPAEKPKQEAVKNETAPKDTKTAEAKPTEEKKTSRFAPKKEVAKTAPTDSGNDNGWN